MIEWGGRIDYVCLGRPSNTKCLAADRVQVGHGSRS